MLLNNSKNLDTYQVKSLSEFKKSIEKIKNYNKLEIIHEHFFILFFKIQNFI